MSYNMNVNPPMQMTLSFDLKLQHSKLENTTTSESQLPQKEKLATAGLMCTKCDRIKPIDDFRNYRQAHNGRFGKFYHCLNCEQKQRDGVALAKQNASPKPECCQCCGKVPKKFHLDHDHETGEFRGWLCSSCNAGIGMLGDSIKGIENALRYLNETTNWCRLHSL